VLAGRDALRKGTWLGLTKHGRFSLLTNYREVGKDTTAATKVTWGLLTLTGCALLKSKSRMQQAALQVQVSGNAHVQVTAMQPAAMLAAAVS
jgi:uncharacterized protein with NRDE domain